jgi:hypothetical protein
VLVGCAAQTLRQAHTQEIERRPGLMEGRGLGKSVEEYFIGVGMLEGKLEIPFEGLGKSAGLAERGE